ncbi:MAG: RpiB/LacA/LacB family sugar-phosphate isomerase [Dehalococcoidia bacterium]
MTTVAFGADDCTEAARFILQELRRRGFDVRTYGAIEGAGEPWGEIGVRVGRDVASGLAQTGIVCCYTGTGVTMAANKVAGVRAALCADAEVARGARAWNDANVLGLALSRLSVDSAREILDAWFEPIEVDSDEQPSIDLLAAVERGLALSD